MVAIILALALTLGQLGGATKIFNLAFGMLLGAVTVAVALAFGLSGREIAARKVEEWIASFNDE